MYQSIVIGKEKVIKDEETIMCMEILEKGIEECS